MSYCQKLLDAWLELKYGSLRSEESVTLPVLSGSMMPDLVPGGEIEIQGEAWQKCQMGDIIVFKEAESLIAHRLLFRLCVRGKWFLFQKGDRNAFGHWIPAEWVVGVVVESRSVVGTPIDFRTIEAKRRARASAYKELMRDIRSRLLVVPKAVVPRGTRIWLREILKSIV